MIRTQTGSRRTFVTARGTAGLSAQAGRGRTAARRGSGYGGSPASRYRPAVVDRVRPTQRQVPSQRILDGVAPTPDRTHVSFALAFSALALGALLCCGCASSDCPRGALVADSDDLAEYRDRLNSADGQLARQQWDAAIDGYFQLRREFTEAGDGTCKPSRWYRTGDAEYSLEKGNALARAFIIRSGGRQALAHLGMSDWPAAARALDGAWEAIGKSAESDEDWFVLLRAYVRYRVFGEQAGFGSAVKQLLPRYETRTFEGDGAEALVVDMEVLRSECHRWILGDTADATSAVLMAPLGPMFEAIEAVAAGQSITRRVMAAETPRPRVRHGAASWADVEKPRQYLLRDPEDATARVLARRELAPTDAVRPYQYALNAAQMTALREAREAFLEVFSGWLDPQGRGRYREQPYRVIRNALSSIRYGGEPMKQAVVFWQAFADLMQLRDWQRRGDLATATANDAANWDAFLTHFPHWQDLDRTIRALVVNLHAPAGAQTELLAGLDFVRQRVRLDQRRAQWEAFAAVMQRGSNRDDWLQRVARTAQFLGQLEEHIGARVAEAVLLLQGSQPAQAEASLRTLDTALAQWPGQPAMVAAWRPRIALLIRHLQLLNGGDRDALAVAWKTAKDLTPRQLRAELRRVVDSDLVPDATLALLGDFGADMAAEPQAKPAESPAPAVLPLQPPAEAMPVTPAQE